MEFYRRPNAFWDRNYYSCYEERPRKFKTCSRKFKNQFYNNYEVEAYSKTPNLYIHEVLEDMKKGVKKIQCLMGKMTQNVDRLSEQWQEFKKEIIQENQEFIQMDYEICARNE